MKRLLTLLMGVVLLAAIQVVWADDTGKMASVATPVASSTPLAKHKVKKNRKKPAKKEAQTLWVCPMGDYSGPKTADGKCPTCGMDLVAKK